MPRAERFTLDAESAAVEARLFEKKTPSKRKSREPKPHAFYEAAADRLSELNAEQDPKRRATMVDELAMDISAQRGSLSSETYGTLRNQIQDLWPEQKGKGGKKRSIEEYTVIQNLLERLGDAPGESSQETAARQNDRVSELRRQLTDAEAAATSGPGLQRMAGRYDTARLRQEIQSELAEAAVNAAPKTERDLLRNEWEADLAIAEEQRQVAERLVAEINTDVTQDADLTDNDRTALQRTAERLTQAIQNYDHGDTVARNFATDVALASNDLSELRERIDAIVAARSSLKRTLRAQKTERDTAPEITTIADGVAKDAGREPLARKEFDPPENLPVEAEPIPLVVRKEADEIDVEMDLEDEDLEDEGEPIPLEVPKEEPIPLEVRKMDVADETPEEAVIGKVQYELRAQEEVDQFMTLDADTRTARLAELKTYAQGGDFPREAFQGWTKFDFQKLVRELEGVQRGADRAQQGERERADRNDSPEATRGRLKKQMETMIRETPDSARLLRVHTGFGWETLSAESFANRYFNLLNKDLAYRDTQKQASFIKRVGRFLIGRKGPEDTIMSGAEREEFKQMDNIIQELGIEKSTYTTASPSIR